MDRKYKVSGMTCGGCASSVTRAVKAAAPAAEVEVSLETAQVRVAGAHSEEDVRRAVEDAGFDFGGPA